MQCTAFSGYAVSSGQYFDPKSQMVAVSSPREGGELCQELGGSVLIMNVSEESPWAPYVALHGSNNSFGSYFGAAMESVDINNDGLDDLIVGAPLECAGEAGETQYCDVGTEDAGCIYIYSQQVILI